MTPRKLMDADEEDKQKQDGEGIIKESFVQLRSDPNIKGIVLDICESRTDQVWWKHETEKNVKPIVELKLLKNGKFSFYPAHLPVFRHYPVIKLEVDVNRKIEVVIWRSVQWKNEETFDPSLYLIFANPEEDKSLTLLEDVVKYAKRTKLPCHITGHRVLYMGGTTAFIHRKTEKDIVKKLTENGISKFERMDIVDADNTENEIRYFKRMAEYEIGEEVLPVIISIQNGGIKQELLRNAAKSHIPIIRLKKGELDFIVLWPNKCDDKCPIDVAEYKSHQVMPHRVKKSGQNDTYNVTWPDEITLASQIKYDVHHLIKSVIVGGYMEKESWPIEKYEIQVYLTALSMYLLKNEMWTIPKMHVKMPIDQRSLEYIYEEIPCLIVLAAVHLFVMPLLMINMEARPLRWFYNQYKLPILKVITNMLGFLFLLIAYAYMLLFDYSDDGITNSDWFIIMWMTSFVVDESKQVIVAFIRDKLEHYKRDWGNILDWILITGYTTGMLLRAGEGSVCLTTSKCLLVAVFMLLCIRLLNICCMTQFLGPKVVIIRKMLKDTISFMIIMTFIMVWYSVSYYALSYPNSEFSWKQIEQIVSNGYWILFGELNLDGDTLTVPYCTFNRTIYEMGALKRCPTQLGLYLTPYLKAFYGLIAVLLMLNLLIAIYSDTFNKVQQKSDFYWRKKQIGFLEEFSIKTIFPIHLQILALPGMVCAIMWCCHSYLCGKEIEKKLNHLPMIVRVFIYNTNYDLVLTSTKVAEENGANLRKASKTNTKRKRLR